MIADGWYLMSTSDLETMLSSFRAGAEVLPDGAVALTVAEALAFRDAGNLPDEDGRTLRLVLRVEGPKDLLELEARRRRFEPDHLDPPTWRVEGSRPVNVVPLRGKEVQGRAEPWWEEAELGALERQWQAEGRVDGVAIPGEYRGFVFKTVLALRAAGREVSADSIAGSIERWVPDYAAAEIRAALRDVN